MALTIKHRADGTFYEQGNTQGLLIPRDREPDYDSGVILNPVAGTNTYYAHGLNTPMENLDIHVLVRRAQDGAWQMFNNQIYLGGTTSYGFSITTGDNNAIGFMIAAGGLTNIYNYNLNSGNVDAYRILIWKKTERVPYIIANKGALVSSPDMGKIAINPDDATMSVNGIIGYDEAQNAYSLMRPDLWPNGRQIIFPQKLAGIRLTGSYNTGAPNENVYWTRGDDAMFSLPIARVLEIGGHMGSIFNFSLYQFPANCHAAMVASSNPNITNIVAMKWTSIKLVTFNHTDAYSNLSTNYDVWLKYVLA
jgi:hypothetical protein